MTNHSPVCARNCGKPARMWTGAWKVTATGAWLGWCSSTCKNLWLDGDKEAS